MYRIICLYLTKPSIFFFQSDSDSSPAVAVQRSAGGKESIERERQFGLAACRAGGHSKQRAGRSRRGAARHIRSAAKPRTAWWQFDWRRGVRACGRGGRRCFRDTSGNDRMFLRVTSQRRREREKRRGGHIWTHSWLMQLRVRPRTRAELEYQNSHLSGPNCDAWWDCVSYAHDRSVLI